MQKEILSLFVSLKRKIVSGEKRGLNLIFRHIKFPRLFAVFLGNVFSISFGQP